MAALKKSKKTKADALPVPQDDVAANDVLRLFGEIERELEDIETRMKARLAEVKAEFESEAAPHKEAAKVRMKQMLAFAAAHRDRLTGAGKIKTVEMAAGKFGWRTRPAGTKLAPGKTDEDVIAELLAMGMRSFIRRKLEVDREALIASPERAALLTTICVGSEGEIFFVEPFGAELAELKS